MRPVIIGYKTSGELKEQPGDVHLFSTTSHTGSVLRKAAGSSRSVMENSSKNSKTRMQALELDCLGSNLRSIQGLGGVEDKIFL